MCKPVLRRNSTSCAAAVSCRLDGRSDAIMLCTSSRLSTPSPFWSKCLEEDATLCTNGVSLLQGEILTMPHDAFLVEVLCCLPGHCGVRRIRRNSEKCLSNRLNKCMPSIRRSLHTSTPEQLHSGSLGALHPGNVSGQLQRGRHCLSP